MAKQPPRAQTLKCEICSESVSKYRCPSCGIRYCSVPCFRNHKKEPCSSPQTNHPPDVISSSSSSHPPLVQQPTNEPTEQLFNEKTFFQRDETLPLSQSSLEKLSSDPQLISLCSHSKLQKLILEILSSPNPRETLQHVRSTNEDFMDFVDQVLAVTNPEITSAQLQQQQQP